MGGEDIPSSPVVSVRYHLPKVTPELGGRGGDCEHVEALCSTGTVPLMVQTKTASLQTDRKHSK